MKANRKHQTARFLEIEGKPKTPICEWIWECPKCAQYKNTKSVCWGYDLIESMEEENPLCEISGFCLDCVDRGDGQTEVIKVANNFDELIEQ